MTTANTPTPSRWRRLSGPIKIGLIAAALGIALAVVGIIRGNVPLNALSILLALVISGGSWGVVAWAVATAASDVDADLDEAQAEAESAGETAVKDDSAQTASD